MARKLTKEELPNHKNNALKKLDAYLTQLIDSFDKAIRHKEICILVNLVIEYIYII